MHSKARSVGLAGLAGVTGLVGLVAACHGSSASSGDAPATSASAAPSASESAVAAHSASARVMPPPPRCRAVSVSGTSTLVSIPGVPLDAGPGGVVTESEDIPDDVWIDLQKGAKLTTRHPHSTRETTFTGPGRVRTCVGHAEESWLVEGKFESVLSSGERPGAEEWIITPFGVVRYASARVEVAVTSTKTEVKVTSGIAYGWTGEHASALTPPEVLPKDAPNIPDGWTRLEGTRAVTFTAKKASKPDEAAETAIVQCTDAAKASKELALAVAGPDASLAKVAPRHVIARHLARAACDVALLHVGMLPPSPARDGLYTRLKEAEGDWRANRPRGHGRRP